MPDKQTTAAKCGHLGCGTNTACYWSECPIVMIKSGERDGHWQWAPRASLTQFYEKGATGHAA